MIASRQRNWARAAETRSALALAVLTMTALLLAADRIALWDLGVLKRRVERLFQVTLAPAAEPKPANYDAEAPARLSEELRREKMKELFKFPEEIEVPREAPLTLSPSGVQPPPPTAAPLFSRLDLARDKTPPPDLPLVAQRPSARQPAEVRLDEFYGDGHLLAPQAKPGSDIFRIPGSGEAEAPKPTAPEAIGAPTVVLPPESAGAVSRRLIEERPAEGYPSLDDDLEARFIVYRPAAAAEAYFELTLALKTNSRLVPFAKDVLFLVDISQSISNAELRLVREAVVQYLSRLPADDGWNVMVFSEQSETLIADAAFAPAARFQAEEVRKFIDRRPGQRRTDVFQVTRQILSGLPRTARPCNVFLLSDGKPTQGISDVHMIVHDFARVNRDNFSIFTFDAGPGGNQYLLRLLAYRSRGFAAQCAQAESAASALLNFLQQFEAPVLTNVVWSLSLIHI
ncbi:MAG: VWA domain-containing protein, partial [Planctomycetota bacterium]|nr:VWA domain-containing protein [Planctomycetota bacterium]